MIYFIFLLSCCYLCLEIISSGIEVIHVKDDFILLTSNGIETGVVYEIAWASCDKTYIEETARTFGTRSTCIHLRR